MLTGRSTKMKVDVCLAIVLKLLLAVDIKKVGVKEFWKYGSYSQFLGSDTNFSCSSLAEISFKKEYLLSEKYMVALLEQFGTSLVVS
jgi:hypothetical protein